ncbi:MAG: leucyl/phenylalanyl-tRNA--protein transferase [Verrucomicrobia bacterium]|nr:MAG: leucyl/phenylalanyl-tRNA--protein transferase [Verrucomicrobiota bacterium]
MTPDFLLQAYRRGFFPMAVKPGHIEWFSPSSRGILFPNEFHIPHGLRRCLKAQKWRATVDTAFPEVILACSKREETWIDDIIFHTYCHLFSSGHAHSLEIWLDSELAGGLYGVAVGGVFFGESMFHKRSNGSKVALKVLVDLLKAGGFLLLDTQWTTPHLEQFGIRAVPRAVYLSLLKNALNVSAQFPQKGEIPV